MDYKYNELSYAQEIYEKGFQSHQHLPTELRLVATYMRRILNYRPKKLREEFYKWCEEHIDGYNRVLYYKTINQAIDKATKKDSCLVTVSPVTIYKPEIEYITNSSIVDNDGCEYEYSYECKKLMFTFLVRSKINKQMFNQRNTDISKSCKGTSFSGGQKKYTELKKMAKLPQKLNINKDIIYYLYRSGLVTPMNSGILRLNFLDNIYSNIDTGCLDYDIEIKDFDRIGWYFDLYQGKNNVMLCKYCNLPFKRKANRQEYCNEMCSSNAKKEYDRQYHNIKYVNSRN